VLLLLLPALPQRPPLLQSKQPGQPRRWSPSKAAVGPSRAEGERSAAEQSCSAVCWWPRAAVGNGAWRRVRARARGLGRAVAARAGQRERGREDWCGAESVPVFSSQN
jgi:hypothetical protein